MAESVKFSLKLLIDEKRNRVVLAEAEQDFVDVLLSLLTLPMGKVAKLLENHKTALGCHKNLNRSVADMGIGHFETEACKSMLMYPRSTKEIHCRKLKMNMGNTNPTEFFVCPNFFRSDSCRSRQYSNFNTSRCSCGSLMDAQIQVSEKDQVGAHETGDIVDGVFVNCRSSFIVTDDLKVISNSIGVLMEVLNKLGYTGLSDLGETLIDVGFEEVVTLLGCFFTSEAPLTCAFLSTTFIMTRKRINEMLSLPTLKNGNINRGRLSLKVFVRKLDKEILYAECNEDFIDSLLSFLVHPLELACSLSTCSYIHGPTILGCVRNLCTSMCRGLATKSCLIPWFYACSNHNLLIYAHQYTKYQCLIPRNCYSYTSCKVARSIDKSLSEGGNIVSLNPNNPKVKPGTSPAYATGFMIKETKFVVSNDLIITPMNSSSTIGLLKKMQLDNSDLEEYQISISEAEIIRILRASLISSSALTYGLSHLFVKKET